MAFSPTRRIRVMMGERTGDTERRPAVVRARASLTLLASLCAAASAGWEGAETTTEAMWPRLREE
jgi:hypothetical protein